MIRTIIYQLRYPRTLHLEELKSTYPASWMIQIQILLSLRSSYFTGMPDLTIRAWHKFKPSSVVSRFSLSTLKLPAGVSFPYLQFISMLKHIDSLPKDILKLLIQIHMSLFTLISSEQKIWYLVITLSLDLNIALISPREG